MFGINTKEIFQQKISDVITILFAIHILAVVFNYIIKRIRPYLRNRAAECNKQTSQCTSEYSLLFGKWFKNHNTKASLCSEWKGGLTEEEYKTFFGKSKTLVNTAENPSNTNLNISSLMKINMMSDSEFEHALNLGSFIRRFGKRKCSSEAQTNITISPEMKLDYSCPELVLHSLMAERVIKTTESSDSFLSACSQKSSTELKKELEQIIKELEIDDESGKTDEDVTMQKLQSYLKSSLAKTDAAESFERSRHRVNQENKFLEIAITEFEKELKPIKDQIQILKECISGFDVSCKAQNNLPSDFTSSFSGSGLLTESCSGTLSTGCISDMQSYFSSYHIVSATSFGYVETDTKYKNIKKLDKIAYLNSSKNKNKTNQYTKHSSVTNKGSSKAPEGLRFSEKCKSSKRSPIAEMYVKLSQVNSQSSCLVMGKELTTDNTVTYRIDLNLNLAGVPVTNSQKSKQTKEREITPLTSDPDEILGKPKTNISLRHLKK